MKVTAKLTGSASALAILVLSAAGPLATAFDNKVYLFAIGIADRQHYMNIYP